MSSPLFSDSNIIFADDTGTIFNINQRGKINWKKNIYKNIYKKIYKILTFSISNNKIYIADSSEHRIHIEKTKKVIDFFSEKLDITYGQYPKANIEEAQLLILQEVSDKYSAYCGDDDFLISKSLQECSDFLK